MGQSRLSRRAVLKTAALGSAAAITAPYVSGVYAAGTLSLGCWDHWVPGANKTLDKLCKEWGDKNKVDVHVDYITSQGEKDKLTAAAEAQAGTGHDIMSHRDWTSVSTRRNSSHWTTSSPRSLRRTARSARSPNISPRARACGLVCQRRSAAR